MGQKYSGTFLRLNARDLRRKPSDQICEDKALGRHLLCSFNPREGCSGQRVQHVPRHGNMSRYVSVAAGAEPAAERARRGVARRMDRIARPSLSYSSFWSRIPPDQAVLLPGCPGKGLSDYTPQSASDGNEAQPGDRLSG